MPKLQSFFARALGDRFGTALSCKRFSDFIELSLISSGNAIKEAIGAYIENLGEPDKQRNSERCLS